MSRKAELETSYINENEITGVSIDDIKRRLYERFKNGYQILAHTDDFVGGFLGFGKKHIIRARYKVLMKDTPESFDSRRQQILNNVLPASDVATVLQMASLKKQLDSFGTSLEKTIGKSIEEKLDKMSSSLGAKSVPSSIERVKEKLLANDFSGQYIDSILNRLSCEFSLTDLEDEKKVEEKVVEWIIDSIKITKEKDFSSPHIVVLVGPTGVGKTSTISKMAVYFTRLARKKAQDDSYMPKVKMITTDRIRMGAEEQLTKFCDVLKFKMQKAEDTNDLKEVLQDRFAFDYVFIDTSGCSPKDVENIAKIKKMLDIPSVKFDIYLVISADKRVADIRSIIQNYEMFGSQKVIVTKTDETTVPGNVISVLSEKEKQIAYIGTGQRITEDFQKASVLMFLSKLADFNIEGSRLQELTSSL